MLFFLTLLISLRRSEMIKYFCGIISNENQKVFFSPSSDDKQVFLRIFLTNTHTTSVEWETEEFLSMVKVTFAYHSFFITITHCSVRDKKLWQSLEVGRDEKFAFCCAAAED
jgi:hypothetical protein